MGWERRRGRLYYYESRWQDGAVIRKYKGSGAAGKAAADAVAARALKRASDRLEVMHFKSNIEEVESTAKRLSSMAECLMAARLFADGFYLASYTWRKRKISNDCNDCNTT